MTSSTDADQHPDVSEISDLTEGLLPPSRATELRRHLDGCALCSDVHTSLEEIRGLLGTLPGGSRMPADVAGRIDAALAAEVLLSATAPESSVDVSRETSTETPVPPTAPNPSARRPAGHSRAATGPGRSRRTRRRTAVLGAVLSAAAVGLSVVLFQSGGQMTADSGADTSVSATSEDSGEFSGVPVQDRVHTLLSAGTASAEPRIEKAPSAEADGPAISPKSSPMTAVPPCVQRGTGRTEPPLAFEEGRYAGTDAYLVVLPHPTDATRIQAYVVDASCVSASTPSGDLLLTRTYPRG
ncbi:hypothetical protein [Streptomyces genisteinicus]|uniref:Zinc-finger domain-containing protein n=1 Tax=Streptomyces genisteinicus TaxID=2768068 RepID=A0A7H0HUI9_9ACTN|nr:hypothetical protein [Streptomyces genisteinicus]QNP64205.1 hypothetical protein IAG43_15700 [Streptomyces genisteinicus]